MHRNVTSWSSLHSSPVSRPFSPAVSSTPETHFLCAYPPDVCRLGRPLQTDFAVQEHRHTKSVCRWNYIATQLKDHIMTEKFLRYEMSPS